MSFWWVDELWPGSTVAVIGSGPSLTAEQCEALRGHARIIAVNDALRLVPWADVHYFCDSKWYYWHHAQPWFRDFRGLRVTLENPDVIAVDPSIRSLKNYGFNPDIEGQRGLCPVRNGVFSGYCSGYQASGLAAHLGAARLLYLGMDMRLTGRAHFFGEHPDKTHPVYPHIVAAFATLVPSLRQRGIEAVNCTPGSALTCFRCAPLDRVLADSGAAALPA